MNPAIYSTSRAAARIRSSAQRSWLERFFLADSLAAVSQARIKILVVDDTRVERMMLRRVAERHEELEILGEAESAAEALEKIRENQPDVLFLDVHMPVEDGFDLLRGLAAPPKVVFVSAWDTYAVDAFALDAVDYLLKPVSPARFAATVDRLKRIFLPSQGGVVRHQIEDRICLRTMDKTVIVRVSEIVVLLADGDFTRALLAGEQEMLVCRRLGQFDGMLPEIPFVRLDRSLIINLSRMQKVERHSRDLMHLWMHGVSRPIAVGRTAYERLRGTWQ